MMRKLAAEFIGTFVLIFCGFGSAVMAGPKIGYLGVALAFGLSLLVMVYVIGPVSGCHINPAVTVGAWLSRKIQVQEAAGYIGAQILGAIVGASLVFVIAQGAPGGFAAIAMPANGYGAHSPAENMAACTIRGG